MWVELLVSGAFLRVVRWQPLAVAAAAVIAVGLSAEPTDPLPWLRVAGLLLVLGAAFVIDDVSAASTAAVPLVRAYRLSLRIGAALLVVLIAGEAALVGAPVSVPVVVGVTFEAVTVLVLALASAAIALYRYDAAEPGLTGVGVALSVISAAIALPPRWALLAGTGSGWFDAHLRWSALLAVGVVALVAAVREPVRRTLRRRHAERSWVS